MTSQKIKYFHSDNERAEFCNLEFDKFLNECGIQKRLSAPHCPQQNGLAERNNRYTQKRGGRSKSKSV
jgi:transposase InsO family protein